MVHRKKTFSKDYSGLLINLDRAVPADISNALVVAPGEGAVPVWLFQNRPAFVTVSCFFGDSSKNEVIFENNTDEFSHSLARLNGRHIETLDLLVCLPTRYDFIYFTSVDSDCFKAALALVAPGGLFILEENIRFPDLYDDLVEYLATQSNSFERLRSSSPLIILRKL